MPQNRDSQKVYVYYRKSNRSPRAASVKANTKETYFKQNDQVFFVPCPTA